MNKLKAGAQYATVVVSAVYSCILYFAHNDLALPVRLLLYILPVLVIGGLLVFDKWLWRVPVVAKWHSRPVLAGLWSASIRPTENSRIPEGGNRGPIEAYIVIEQTFWTTQVSLMTAESQSTSLAAALYSRAEGDGKSLVWSYRTNPRSAVRDRNYSHQGQGEISVPPGGADLLEGTYFTDRLTTGDMTLRRVSTHVRGWTFITAQEASSALGA